MKLFPLDRAVLLVSLLLTIAIGVVWWQGDQTVPQVREFTWHNRVVTGQEEMFMITFSRPMNTQSVESNLQIVPPLVGKFSWSGRRMAYTLTRPIPYGQKFTLTIKNATDRYGNSPGQLHFSSNFFSPDRAFVYIGSQGEEAGRLVLHNFTQGEHRLLTPPNQVVTDFRIYPDRARILYSAIPQGENFSLLDQELFTVTTGIGNSPGQIAKILDKREYQIFRFDLAPDGSKIVVQRLNRATPGSYGLWQISNQKLTPLRQPPGGEFMIAPDNYSLAITQGEGVAILALEEGAEPLDFLPKFGNILCFNRDGSQAAMIRFNKDYTRSLFLVTNQGQEQELMRIHGSFLGGQFDFTSKFLYLLLTDVEQTATTYQEHPYLAVLDLQEKKAHQLLDLKGHKNVGFHLSPDNQEILLATDRSPLYVLSVNPLGQNPGTVLTWWGKQPRWLP
ncbi:MAG: Ig-like domain-containing protein [Pseudanabaenaceae cyanobacterium]